MRRSGTGSGGGYGMNKNVSPPVRTGSGSFNARPAGVAQIGTAIGDHSTNSGRSTGYRGEKLHGPAERNFPTKFGNEVAANTVCGPGSSRTIYKTGAQDLHGSGGPQKPQGRPILSEYGPDYQKPRS
jgi:hypothetical protein